MKYALSTNWCNRRLARGEDIVEEALALGFDALELGFHTTDEQVKGFKARLDEMPVGSVHAFCPVPISAPQGYPELYSLASFDEETRRMARFQIKKNIRFASEMGAGVLVLHLGRVMCSGWISAWNEKRRIKRGRKMLEIAKRELAEITPELEANNVVLGLENLPYREGFPAAWEMAELCGEWVRPWLDTGHDFVIPASRLQPIGFHIHDSIGGDDHLAPGMGMIDFSQFKELAKAAKHLVFEPYADISAEKLSAGLSLIKNLWQ